MNFKLWIESIESKLEKAISRRDFRFDDVFKGKSRIYIPFNGNVNSYAYEKTIADPSIVNLIANFQGGGKFPYSSYGYKITDYKMGFAKPGDTKDKRVYRISKIIDQSEQNQINDLKKSKERSYTPEQEEFIKEKFDFLRKTFQNSHARIRKNDSNGYLIVFSSDPKDIAYMSTDRHWTSCMNLRDKDDKHKNHNKPYCEVRNGGFVAYLIKEDDKDIKNPISRILIRRYEDRQHNSYAIPEDAVYGDQIPGFHEAVDDWIKKNTKPILPGKMYRLKGMSYTDTLDEDIYKIEGDKQLNSITKWLNSKKVEDIQNNPTKYNKILMIVYRYLISNVHFLNDRQIDSFGQILEKYLPITNVRRALLLLGSTIIRQNKSKIFKNKYSKIFELIPNMHHLYNKTYNYD